MSSEQITPGKTYTRADLKEVFGGGEQGGIIPSRTTDNILLFTDHDKAKIFGYQDGWLAEEDELGPVFEYTGQGTLGDQTLKGNNGSVLRHAEEGRALHHFMAVGYVEGTGTRIHRYVGQFVLDEDEPFVERRVLDSEQKMRWVYVFRLRPVIDIEQKPEDFVPVAPMTDVTVLSALPLIDPAFVELTPAMATTGESIPPEKNSGKKVTRKASEAVEVKRREAELSGRFLEFLNEQGHTVDRFKIRVQGLTSTFFTDLYDQTDNMLYELKGSSSRNAVRMALGQLLDYRRHIPPKDARLVVVLPERPEDDLASLIESAGMGLVYEDGDKFVGWPVV
ncbi:hypothetical protein M2161_005367 [Streptomyces sp. SAI-133]|uniref:hypothetical protein n=1 Tax=unclassified Streptomyces TaxID=2593676 RepID=UPI002476A1DA|nr:hypothetical protein [Streptomyces sp. SAI-133]MDH6586261.1 hypothetical protein [Streptomyces sp. SAI-133]